MIRPVHCVHVNSLVQETDKHSKVAIFEVRDRFFMNFSKIPFSKSYLQILKLVQSVQLRTKIAFFRTWTTRLYPTDPVKSILKSEISTYFPHEFSAKIQYFNNLLFMRKNIFSKLLSKPTIDDFENFKIIGLVVLSTQLHDEIHSRFPTAGNDAFTAVSFVPVCVSLQRTFWKFWTVNQWARKHFREYFFSCKLIEISRFCT